MYIKSRRNVRYLFLKKIAKYGIIVPMKINRIHTILGFLLVIIPFTGFTRGFKYGVSVVAGAIILYFAMRSIHEEIMKRHGKHRRHNSFVENKPRNTPRNEVKIEKPIEPAVPESDIVETKAFSHIADGESGSEKV